MRIGAIHIFHAQRSAGGQRQRIERSPVCTPVVFDNSVAIHRRQYRIIVRAGDGYRDNFRHRGAMTVIHRHLVTHGRRLAVSQELDGFVGELIFPARTVFIDAEGPAFQRVGFRLRQRIGRIAPGEPLKLARRGDIMTVRHVHVGIAQFPFGREHRTGGLVFHHAAVVGRQHRQIVGSFDNDRHRFRVRAAMPIIHCNPVGYVRSLPFCQRLG